MVQPLMGLTSGLWVVLASVLALGVLQAMRGWSRRRDLQVLVLAAPLVSLGLAVGQLHQVTGQVCFIGTLPWDYRLGVALPFVMGLVALAAVALGLVRLVLMQRVVARRGASAPRSLIVLTRQLASRLQMAPPRLRVVGLDRPLALTYGLVRPTVVLSTWMLAHLDGGELESVLAHELGHVRRRDYLMVWLATVLRDAFVYLPTSWLVYRQLQREKEPACDDLAVSATGRPLALASALAKVWEHVTGGPAAGLAQSLAPSGEAIEGRITRLLVEPTGAGSVYAVGATGLRLGLLAVAALLALELANAVVLLAPMSCGPASALSHLF